MKYLFDEKLEILELLTRENYFENWIRNTAKSFLFM